MLRVIAGLAVIAVMAAVGWWWLSDGESAAAPQRPPTTVNVVPAISRPLSDNLEVVGTARATRAIVLVTQVDGRVDKIHFQESQDVEAGDLLVTLDARAARAETDRTRADYQRALSDYQRASRLVGGSAISEAEVANLKTTMESARAIMEASRVALEDHSLRAPFDGVVGLRPTPGRVPAGPSVDPFQTLSVEGPMGRDPSHGRPMDRLMGGPQWVTHGFGS